MNTLLTIIPLIDGALDVINTLTPLIQRIGKGEDVTPADVRAALARKDKALADFDALIAKLEAEDNG